jgi:hypothetical protein
MEGKAKRLHQTSSANPMAQLGCWLAQAISRSRAFFLLVQRIGAADAMFDPLPVETQPSDGLPNSFARDQLARQSMLETDLGKQGERPDAGLFSTIAWATLH